MNIHLNDEQWTQATLPIRMGGLGIRKVEDIALPSFLSSTFGAKDLVSQIMNINSSDDTFIHHFEDAINTWNEANPNRIPKNPEYQRQWDEINTKRITEKELHFASPEEKSRILAS